MAERATWCQHGAPTDAEYCSGCEGKPIAEPMVPLKLLSAALDEIYNLRAALAYESLVIEGHLGYKTFPKSRREVGEGQVLRMMKAARDGGCYEYSEPGRTKRKAALRLAGADECLTRDRWERQAREQGRLK